MKCPQCQCENQFPVPGLCPVCYKQWKDSMRARYGPGPWPVQPPGAERESVGTTSTVNGAGIPPSATPSRTTLEHSVSALLEYLQQADNSNQTLEQVETVIRELTRKLTYVANMS